jgi:hypothetical protein
MGAGMDACNLRMATRRALVCGFAIFYGNIGIPQASAGAIPRHTTAPARGALITAATAMTFSVQDIEAEPGNDTPVAITLPSPAQLRDAGAGDGTFILIRNMPEGLGVSAGMAIGRIWVVPLRDSRALRLISKPGMSTRFQLEFHLIGPNNRILAETTVTVAVQPRDTVAAIGAPPPKAEAPKPDAPDMPVRPRTGTASRVPQDETVLMARGEEAMRRGGVAVARRIFEELAARGSAAGALALARSYDPARIARSQAPDIVLALKWYERAAELGNPDAKRRLAEIVWDG